jgi:hypothetical protein
MLDVHAPEHRVGGARDFFVHLFTITCGLLIALALEAGAEAVHHRHQRMEAEGKIRQEIRTNEEALRKAYPTVLQERKGLQELWEMAEEVNAGKKPENKLQVPLSFSEMEIPDAAWRTASSTGTLEYLPYDEVERFADAYREQELLQGMEQKTLEDYLQLVPPQQLTLTKENAPHFLEGTQRAMGHLNGIMAAGQGTMDSYKKALD